MADSSADRDVVGVVGIDLQCAADAGAFAEDELPCRHGHVTADRRGELDAFACQHRGAADRRGNRQVGTAGPQLAADPGSNRKGVAGKGRIALHRSGDRNVHARSIEVLADGFRDDHPAGNHVCRTGDGCGRG